MLHALIYAAAYCLDGIILLALGFVVHEAFHPGALVAAAAMLAVGAIVCASIA